MGFADFARDVHARRFDLLIGLQVYFKAGVLTALAPATVKLGFDRTRARDMQWLFTTHRIAPHEPQHVQDQYFEFLDYLGVDAHPVTWGLELTDQERAAQRAYFDRLDRPACAVVVAAGASPSSAFRLASAAKGPAVSITVGAVSTPPPAPLFHPDAAIGTGMFVLKVGVCRWMRAQSTVALRKDLGRAEKRRRASTWRLTRDAWIVIEFLHCKVVRNIKLQIQMLTHNYDQTLAKK